jgi:hypothetical protein
MSNQNKDNIYDMWQGKDQNQKMLREINNDDMTPRRHDFEVQNELHEKIRNDEDYDDWEYGTEPIPLNTWKMLNK